MSNEMVPRTAHNTLGYTTEPVLKPEHDAAVEEAERASKAANTAKAYGDQVRLFEAWCGEHGYSALPAHPITVAAYLVHLHKRGLSRSTINVAYSAIKAGHQLADYRFDDQHPRLVSARRGVGKKAMREQKQAAALTPALLRGMLEMSDETPLEIRDAAMAALLYVAALRRSELTGLDYQDWSGAGGGGTGVFRLTEKGLEIEMLTSKTSQDGSVKIFVSRDDNPRAFAVLGRWIRTAGIGPGTPLIRRISPKGTVRPTRISGDGLDNALKKAVARYFEATGDDEATARTKASAYSGHSGRVGFVTTALEAGALETDVAATTRHKGLAMIQRYGQQADQKKRAAHKLKGVGV